MSVLPIVSRELSVQARRKSTYWIRVLASGIASFLMLWLAVGAVAPISTINQGRTLFSVLSILAMVYCLIVGAVVTADCLSAEKREGTIGLLFLTPLKGYDVVFGKLVSSSIHAVFGLLAIVPMMSLALLFGGLTPLEISRTALVLANTLFLSLATGIFVSTVSRNERKAVFAAILLVMIVSVGPYQLAFYVANIGFLGGAAFRLDEAVLGISPIYAFTLCTPTAIGKFSKIEFYGSLAQTHAIAWVLLTMASGIIPGVCKDRPKGKSREMWSERWRRLTLGDRSWQARSRTRLLNQNPCLWLSYRHGYKAVLPWILISGLTMVGIWIFFKYSNSFYEASLILLFTLHVLLKIWITGETCNRWIEDRRSHALELLLCVPLRTREMIRGQGMALRRQFGWPAAGVLGLSVLALYGIGITSGWGTMSSSGRTWLAISIPILIADLVALRWVGMWNGLTSRGYNRAVIATLTRVMFLRWPIYLFMSGIVSVSAWIGFGLLPLISHPFAWLLLALAFDLIFGLQARRKFYRHYRAIASDPLNYRAIIKETRIVRSSVSEAVADKGEIRPSERGGQREDSKRVSRPIVSLECQKGWSRRRKWLVAIASCLLMLCGITGLYRHFLTKKVESRLEALREAGVPTTIEELKKLRPPLPDEENSALFVERAFPALVTPNSLPNSIQRNLPAHQAYFPRRSEPLPIEMRESIGSILSSNKTALSILQTSPDLRKARYAVHWTPASLKFSTQHRSVLTINKLLFWDTYYQAESSRVDKAVNSIQSLLDLAISFKNEPFWNFRNLKNPCLNYAVEGYERLLNRNHLSISELETLRNSFFQVEKLDILPSYLTGLRFYAIDAYRPPQSVSTRFPRGPSAFVEQLRIQLQFQIFSAAGVRDRGLISDLDRLEDFDQVARSPFPERYEMARDQMLRADRSQSRSMRNSMFGSQMLFEQVVKLDAEFAAQCRIVLTSLAIERFRLRNKDKIPVLLSELVPGFMSKIPKDPFDGQPIRFTPLQKGYRVYSIGADGADNGGAELARKRTTKMPMANYDITFTVER